MTLGSAIKQSRKAINLSQEAFGKKLDVTRGAVSSWEKGNSFPSTKNLLALSEIFGTSFDDLTSLSNSNNQINEDPSRYISEEDNDLIKIILNLKEHQKQNLKLFLVSMTENQ